MSDYRISLGIDFNDGELSNIKKQLTNLTDNTHRIRVDIDNSRLLKQIEHAKKELKELNTTSGNKPSLTLNTKSLEESLNKVSIAIDDIRKSFGTIGDNKSGIKNLLSSVNQIANALGKAESESENLVQSLNALSKKDFSINLGVNLGGSNSVSNNIAYGNKVRGEVIPQLKKQVQALVDEYNVVNKSSVDEYNAFLNVISGTKFGTGDIFQGFITGSQKGLRARMENTTKPKEQIQAYKEFIDIFQQAAKLKGINLDSSVVAGLSETTDKLIKEAQDIQTGAKQAKDGMETLQQAFGGSKLDVADISAQLEPIVEKLGEIKIAIEGLSKVGSLDNLTITFDKLSDTLDKLSANFAQVQKYFGTLDNISSGVGDNIAKTTEQTKKLISDSAQEAIDNVSSQRIGKYFEIDKSDSNAFRTEMNNLVKQWTDGKGNLVDVEIETKTSYDKDAEANIERLHRAQVTYNSALDGTITKTIAWRKIGSDFDSDGKENPIYGFAEIAGKYKKTMGETAVQTNNFVKQQKTAVSNLTNQINQMHRAANDQNASKAIKDKSHIEALANKYAEVENAIRDMGNASSATFIDTQNNVRKLISEYRSMVSEFKNAENVSSKMKGTDFASGLKIAKNDLEKFKAEAEGFSIDLSNLDIDSVTDASSLNNFNDQLRIARSELAKIKAETAASNRSEILGIDISGLESKIANLQKISPEIDEFEAEINGAKVTIQSLLTDLKQVNTQSDFSVVNSKFKTFTDSAKRAGIAVDDLVSKTTKAKDIVLKIETGHFDDDLSKIDDKLNKISKAPQGLEENIRAVKTALKEMETAAGTNEDNIVDVEKLVAAYNQYEAALKKVNNQLRIQSRAEKAENDNLKLGDDRKVFQSNIDTWLEKNSAAAKRFGTEMQNLKMAAQSCDRVTLNRLQKEFRILDNEADKAGLKMLSLGDRLKSKFKEYSAYFSVAEVFQYGFEALKNMFEQVKLIDSAMTELKKVTNETDASYNQFLSNAASRAKEIGTTIDGLVSSTADFARLGYDFGESQKLAEVANIYAVVGDEIDGVETATKSLISTMTAFDVQASDSISIVDKFNEIGNNFAISSGGIGEALERSASSMAAANNTLDETIALITAANTVVQDPDAVGTAFKTISMRIKIHCSQ